VGSLWTPDGERQVGPPPEPGSQGRSGDPASPAAEDDEELAAQVEAMRAELAEAPVEVVIANHCYGLFELAAVYLSQQPPFVERARLAIDALGCLVGGLEGRLGDAEPSLKDGLSQLRMAYVQIDAAQRAGAESAAATGPNGGSSASTGPTEADDTPE
jgi:hypothetical protein